MAAEAVAFQALRPGRGPIARWSDRSAMRKRRLRDARCRCWIGGLVAVVLSLAGAAVAQGQNEILCSDATARSGDTLTCGGGDIRLDGVRAPLSNEPGFERSRDGLAALLRFRVVRCRVVSQISPRAARAVCRVGARDLAARQIGSGHVVAIDD